MSASTNDGRIAALRQVFVQVLEEQMFLFADDAELEDISFPAEPMVKVQIAYQGAEAGGLWMCLPQSLCREITASVIGIEEDEIAEGTDITDAAKELINMTCGQFLTTVYGEKQVFNLMVPEARVLTDAELAEIKETFSGLLFLVDEHPVLLALA